MYPKIDLSRAVRTLRCISRGSLAAVLAGPLAFAGAPSAPPVWADLERAVERFESAQEGVGPDYLRKVLNGRECVLEYLPIAQLKAVRAAEGWIEFEFDFNGRASRKIDTPTSELVVWSKRRGGRIRRFETDSKTLTVAKQVRFFVDRRGIRGVREGDLRISWGFFKFDLELHTEGGSPKPVVDDSGRAVLVTDARGEPVRRDGAYVQRQSAEWLVLQAGGKRVEVPLD